MKYPPIRCCDCAARAAGFLGVVVTDSGSASAGDTATASVSKVADNRRQFMIGSLSRISTGGSRPVPASIYRRAVERIRQRDLRGPRFTYGDVDDSGPLRDVCGLTHASR